MNITLPKSLIPADSCLHHWMNIMSTTEVPTSYSMGIGLSVIGALLKRNIYINQHSTEGWGWNVYPNQSIMLVGPSGIGKDTSINYAEAVIEKFPNIIPIIGGTTAESLKAQLVPLGDPAAAIINARELASFFGNRDYQSGMVQEITDLLSNLKVKDTTNKTDLTLGKGKQLILNPTLTMWCGTTAEWLHKAMPDGTMEGGFLGRYLIFVEEMGKKQIPLVKGSLSRQDLLNQDTYNACWHEDLEVILTECKKPREVVLLSEAADLYTNWYYNRFKYFSPGVMPYANRSRDTVLRLAMLMAVSRKNFGWIEDVDIQFAINILNYVANRIDTALIRPTKEQQIAREILKLIPTTSAAVFARLGTKYNLREMKSAEELLREQGLIVKSRGILVMKEQEFAQS